MKCENVKKGWEEANLNTKVYPVVSTDTKPPKSTLLKHSVESIASRPPSLFQNFSWLATKACQVTTVTLVPFSTKELLHVPCTKPSTPLHTKLEGRRLAGEPPKLQEAGTPRYKFEQLSSSTQGTTLCSHTQTWASLALSLTKLVLNLGVWSMSSWEAWRTSSVCR